MRRITLRDLLGAIRLLKTSVLVTKTPLTTLTSLLKGMIIVNVGRTSPPTEKMECKFMNVVPKLHGSTSQAQQAHVAPIEFYILNRTCTR